MNTLEISLFADMLVAMTFSILLGAVAFAQGAVFVEGRLTIRSLNLFCGILVLIILVTILCKHIKDGKEE